MYTEQEQMMTIKAIKLISGEELVGEIIHEDHGVDTLLKEITVKNPLAIRMQRHPNGDLQIGFVPFAPYLGKSPTITFAGNKILFAIEVDTKMASQYNSIFSGIVTPPKEIILG
jgi:hypothetical protein